MQYPLSTRGRNANRQCFEKSAWCTRAQLRYFVSQTSLGIGWEAITQTANIMENRPVGPGNIQGTSPTYVFRC